MKSESIFITLSEKIRKQLEIMVDKEDLTYYEVFGLSEDFKPDDLSRALERSKILLSNLKYHPSFRDQAASAIQTLSKVAEVLRNPGMRSEYNAALKGYVSQDQTRKIEEFHLLIERTKTRKGLTPKQKNDLMPYAKWKGVDRESARSVLDSFLTLESPMDEPVVASPPCLTAPILRYLESPAFQILLNNSAPRLEKISSLRCSNCSKESPITRLFCSCGALMRGKIICLDSSALLSSSMANCPHCGKESNLMLEMGEEDVEKAYRMVEILSEQKKFSEALEICHDILSVKPGDQFIKQKKIEIKEQSLKSTERNKGEVLQQMGLTDWQNGKTSMAYRKLLAASKIVPLSSEASQALEKAAMSLHKRAKKISIISFCFWGFFILLAIIMLVIGPLDYSNMIFGAGFAFLILSMISLFSGLLYLMRVRKYKHHTQMIYNKDSD